MTPYSKWVALLPADTPLSTLARVLGTWAIYFEKHTRKLLTSAGPATDIRSLCEKLLGRSVLFYTYAEVVLQGYVGAVREVGRTLKIRISHTEAWKVDGERKERTIWNVVTVFENTPGFEWIKANIKKGDLIMVRGRVSESSYEKDSVTIYETTLAAESLALIPTGKKADADNGA